MSPDAEHLAIGPPADADDRRWLADLWLGQWSGLAMHVGGRVLHLPELDALIARIGAERAGAATYRVEGDSAELVSLDAAEPGRGVGTALVAAVAGRARAAGARRLVAHTTNDNVAALAFYQRRGFRLVEVRLGAVDSARAAKPAIPLVGQGGVAIRDEWRLELTLASAPAGTARTGGETLPQRPTR